MLEQQFIQWSGTIDPLKKEIPIPVYDSIPLQFFSFRTEDEEQTRIDLICANGDVIQEDITNGMAGLYDRDESGYFIHHTLKALSQYIAPMECFRLRHLTGYFDSNTGKMVWELTEYSNLLRYVYNEDGYLSALRYYCNEPQFGLPFFAKEVQVGNRKIYTKFGAQLALPIRISKPQYKQTDKIYENRNGEQIVLYATINKEYEGETDYIPEEWHEKIVTALSCDEVYINGERVTKSDSYEIDQDNYTYSDCGIRLTRATFKVKTNVTQRNSNC